MQMNPYKFQASKSPVLVIFSPALSLSHFSHAGMSSSAISSVQKRAMRKTASSGPSLLPPPAAVVASVTTPLRPETLPLVPCPCCQTRRTIRLVSQSAANPGRVFYKCPNHRIKPNPCNHYYWEDGEDSYVDFLSRNGYYSASGIVDSGGDRASEGSEEGGEEAGLKKKEFAVQKMEVVVQKMDELTEICSAGRGGRSFPPARSGVFYKFTQQDLPAWKPAMTPGCVITIFLIIGITFVPVGLVCLQASNSVAEIIHRYDVDCVPNAYRRNKQAYIKDSSISKKCIQKVQVQYHMKAPIYVYYELDNFYHNHRRYIKSRSDKQLRHGLKYTESSCSPIEKNNGLPIVPCGLIAWSLFNDTYDFARGSMEIMVDRKNISWRSDREHKFGKDVYPFNFQNGSLIGGGKLDPDIPLSNQEDLIVWMRTAALPRFRKLYGVIEEDLQTDETITMHITNNYNTYTFGGKKSLVLTTTTWLGGKNDFLGYAYLITGSLSIFLTILVALIHVKVPRPHGDAAYVSWSRSNS